MANVVTDSTYYYSNFVVNAVQAADPDAQVVATPTTSFPTAAPVMAPETDNTEGDLSATDGQESNEGETTTTEAPTPDSSSSVTWVFAGTSLAMLGLVGLLL